MFSLIVQTLLLMAIAFILGAILGCLLRSLFGTAEREVVADVQSPVKAVEVPKPPIPEKPVEKAEIFKPVYVPELKAKETPVVKTEPVVAPKPEVVAEPVIVSKPKPKPKPKVKAKPAAKPKPKAKAKPAAKPKAKPAAKPKVKAKPAAKPKAKVKAAAVAKPKAKVKTAAAAKPKAKAKPAAKPKPKPRAPRLKPDNLKLVRGIGPQNEARLNTMGIKQFAQIAAWKKKDTVHYGEALAFPGRIEREEWVKQAKVLAKGGATKFSKRVRSGDVESSLGKAKSVELGKKPRGLRATPRRGKAEDLKEIDGVGPAIEKKLNKAGIHHFDQIAKMTKPELVWLGNAVGYPGTPERENWVKDAKKLAARKSK